MLVTITQKVYTRDVVPCDRLRLGKARASLLSDEDIFQKFVAQLTHSPSSWNTRHSVCRWEGVLCDAPSKVSALLWRGFALRGNLSWSYAPSELTRINIGGHPERRSALTGEIPTPVLTDTLSTIRLACALFRGPVNLEVLPNSLTELDLGTNHFGGEISLSRLPPQLNLLCLRRNLFGGFVNLGALPPYLIGLYLEHNQFCGEIIDVSRLPPRLTELDLSYNQFTTMIPVAGRVSSALAVLDISHNALGGHLDLRRVPASVYISHEGNPYDEVRE